MKITVGIVSYNTRDLTCLCVESVLKAIDQKHGIVVLADNGSSDGTLEAISARYPEVVLLSLPENPGYGGALNQILSKHPAPYFLAMNSDVLVTSDTLAQMLIYLVAHPECALVGPSIKGTDGSIQTSCKRFPTLQSVLSELLILDYLLPNNPWLSRFYYRDVSLEIPTIVETVMGAIMLIRMEALIQIGGFDSRFWLYFEETDLCRRLKNSGYTVAFVPQATAIHVHRASTRQTMARQMDYYTSYAIYAQKHFSQISKRITHLAIQLSTLFRMFILTIKFAPITPMRKRELNKKLGACVMLLKTLRT